MLDIGEVRSSFPQLKQISPLSSASGQKDVLTASLDDQRVVLKLVKANASHDGSSRFIVG